uniref:AlNc14C542G12110 protein n=1 Tax=Albugo laibachii Nc14 TaxID=890382 RepID=F0X121_9STRA|nr:AlNc14C542G12110 [Albugo laibachii Nc14]|eukprot:CCA27472.1 AlNc14C542G12110 [Albugo laibachii Nc14]
MTEEANEALVLVKLNLYSARPLHAQNSLILHFAATPTMPRKNQTYSMRVKRDVLDALRQHSQRAVARRYNISRRTLRYWIGEEDNIRGSAGHERSNSKKRCGVQSIPFAGHLVI